MSRRGGTECILAPRDAWLALLAAGWRFPEDIAQPMRGPHGAWSVLLWRRV
jgi:hypothetical protein